MATLKNASLCQNHAINGERDAEKANYPHSELEKKVALLGALLRRGRFFKASYVVHDSKAFRIALYPNDAVKPNSRLRRQAEA